MVRGLGYSHTDFETANPGRLCRGRERWIQRWEDPGVTLQRLVISGAVFSDDSARDAVRGLSCLNVDVGALVRTVFPKESLWGFKEEGQLADLPEEFEDRGLYWAPRSGGRFLEPCQRWTIALENDTEMGGLVAEDRLDCILVEPKLPLADELLEALYVLTGQGDDSFWPVARFQPLAMHDILQHCRALICIHQDKHGPAIGIYSTDPVECSEKLQAFAHEAGVLPVPFAIPPMLARWDRALYELRVGWSEEEHGEFPVPPASEASRWGGRGRSRNSKAASEE